MQFFSSNGVRIGYVDLAPTSEDRGEPILLIHGFASNHSVNWTNTLWTKTLTHDGRRVIALDNRGHGQSEKLYEPAQYTTSIMAQDAVNLLDHLGVARADVMGYSMGARITAFMALEHPLRMRRAILGGLGDRLVRSAALPSNIAQAMEADTLADLTDPIQRMFRSFAESTKSDLRALAACIRGNRQSLTPKGVAAITCPTLIAVGDKDEVAGDGPALAKLFTDGRALVIPGRDHNLAVGDKVYKNGVIAFLGEA
ncbi:MAG: alpha/beta hydrolase [Beijerinckiaceae bacterium]|nr:alpha/beta hydrolase [Beijerinckiaceae bacterium]